MARGKKINDASIMFLLPASLKQKFQKIMIMKRSTPSIYLRSYIENIVDTYNKAHDHE